MRPIAQIMLLADRYGDACNAQQSTVSWRVFGDNKKLKALEAGADIQVKRWEQALQWFSNNWPDGAEWPTDIPRPAPAEEAA